MQNGVSYHRVAVTRANELGMRIGLALIIAAGVWAITRTAWPAAWFALVVAVQFLDLALTAPMRRNPDFAPTAWQEAGYLGLMATTVLVWGIIGPYCWLTGGLEGHLYALLIPASGLVHVGLQAQSSKRLLWAGCTPHALYLVSLPILSLVLEPGVNRAAMGFVGLGAALFIAHLVIAIRRNRRATVELDKALTEARSERARAEDASAAKSDFLATMSHEIRTPLNGVLGMAQAMGHDRLPKAQRERLEVIRQSGEVLLMLLNDLLDISRIEAAKLELEMGVLDIGGLATQAQAAFAPLAAGKGLTLAIKADPAALGLWRADATRVRQIVYNLLSNAVKFTDRGGVTLAFRVEDDGALAIRVADTGLGVAASQLPTLFERFIQAEASTSRRYGGSGLGLAISRELARLMGGDITAHSEAGQGSVFTARLPLARAEAAAAPMLAEPVHEAPQADLRVLVAEDNETNQLVLRTLLSQVGIDPHVVADGAQAVDAWRTGTWDVVLMDVQMPVMDGLAATRRIRELEAAEGRARTPILALTANAMSHQAAEYVAVGMDGLAPKPIQIEQLIGAIAAALEPRDAEPAAKAG
ncbi:ATP-binding protein [Phenylobacterium sp.]|uniref:ATP-binding protein n=1 Tax=Phenylobacterium sp. TaxID=1871053 RepID=UPI002DF3E379|nr:ATP-binding protein [Phenylobacterium sp.]